MIRGERPKPLPGAPRTSGPGEDPIVDTVAALAARFSEFAKEPGAVLTCDTLLEVIGRRSHLLAIFIFCLLNLLPGPPGYAAVLAVIITALSFMLLRGHDIRLWPVVGRMKLPLRLLLKLVDMLSGLTALIARISAPRMTAIAGPAAVPVIAVIGIILGAAMIVPIPFTNTVPCIGLAVICIGLLNHDGALVLAGLLIGIAGLAILFASIWILIALGGAIEDAVTN
jgi:hypothetical protein